METRSPEETESSPEERIAELQEALQVRNSRKRRPRRFLRYLLYLALLSTVVSSFTMARYVSKGTAVAEARVAALVSNVQVKFEQNLENLLPGQVTEFSFIVANFDGDRVCDTDMDYQIQVTSTKNLPLTFELIPDEKPSTEGGYNALTGPLTDGKAVGGKLPHSGTGKVSHVYKLKITWPETETDAAYSGKVDLVTVSVSSQQVKG